MPSHSAITSPLLLNAIFIDDHSTVLSLLQSVAFMPSSSPLSKSSPACMIDGIEFTALANRLPISCTSDGMSLGAFVLKPLAIVVMSVRPTSAMCSLFTLMRSAKLTMPSEMRLIRFGKAAFMLFTMLVSIVRIFLAIRGRSLFIFCRKSSSPLPALSAAASIRAPIELSSLPNASPMAAAPTAIKPIGAFIIISPRASLGSTVIRPPATVITGPAAAAIAPKRITAFWVSLSNCLKESTTAVIRSITPLNVSLYRLYRVISRPSTADFNSVTEPATLSSFVSAIDDAAPSALYIAPASASQSSSEAFIMASIPGKPRFPARAFTACIKSLEPAVTSASCAS